jgi:alkylated DNA repair protein (DNA oxidative demethylase)
LFDVEGPSVAELAPAVLRAFALDVEEDLLAALVPILAQSPFRHMVTPGGFPMSVAMSNCGTVGWVADRSGYRYSPTDPGCGRPWPAMPAIFARLAAGAAERAGYHGFAPDACLINRYDPGAKLSLHQDKDERDLAAPIVSVSLGLPATFLFGGLSRKDPQQKFRLVHGDVVVWGGAARLAYHGIAPLKDGEHPRLGRHRVNLTFRQAL